MVSHTSLMPKVLWTTFTRGARQFVVHEALEMTFCEEQTRNLKKPTCTFVVNEEKLGLQASGTDAHGAALIEHTMVLGSYLSSLTPKTNIGASAEGAEMMTWSHRLLRRNQAYFTAQT